MDAFNNSEITILVSHLYLALPPSFLLFHHCVEVTSLSFNLPSKCGSFLASLFTTKKDMLPPH